MCMWVDVHLPAHVGIHLCFFTPNTLVKVFQKSVKEGLVRRLLQFVMGLKLRADLSLKFIHPF